MAVSIKYKIRSGTLFLLLLLVISGSLSIYYQVSLNKASRNILKDNYLSLDYCHSMQQQLDRRLFVDFENSLAKEEKNITEPGEKEAVAAIKKSFIAITNGDTSTVRYQVIHENIQKVLTQNMQAIEKKNLHAEGSAEEAYTAIIAMVSLTLMVGLVFAFNFPGVVVTPIKKLMEAIKEISAKNYRHRIHLDTKDEFGQLAEAFNTMSERLEDFENSNLNKLIFEKARAEAVINSLKDASIGIDINDKVLFANQQALQLLGLQKEETIGKPVEMVSQQNDLFKFLVENDSSMPFKIVLEGKENYYIKEVVEVEQAGATNKVIVLKNITSFKEMDVAKTNFIATISHELKTPLASSDFSLKLLEDTRVSNLTEEQKELVLQLKNDNQRMLRILSELLNMSQVESGRIQMNIQQVNAYTIIDASIQAMVSAAKEKRIYIECKVEENLPTINADPDKTSWILNNFFTNAIRFSPEESTVILQVGHKEGSVSFAVTDRGQGIEETYRSRIFERYFQVPGRADNKGSGIGLAICKEFVEAMGGSVWVKSVPGEGSVFGFRLPATS